MAGVLPSQMTPTLLGGVSSIQRRSWEDLSSSCVVMVESYTAPLPERVQSFFFFDWCLANMVFHSMIFGYLLGGKKSVLESHYRVRVSILKTKRLFSRSFVKQYQILINFRWISRDCLIHNSNRGISTPLHGEITTSTAHLKLPISNFQSRYQFGFSFFRRNGL